MQDNKYKAEYLIDRGTLVLKCYKVELPEVTLSSDSRTLWTASPHWLSEQAWAASEPSGSLAQIPVKVCCLVFMFLYPLNSL